MVLLIGAEVLYAGGLRLIALRKERRSTQIHTNRRTLQVKGFGLIYSVVETMYNNVKREVNIVLEM